MRVLVCGNHFVRRQMESLRFCLVLALSKIGLFSFLPSARYRLGCCGSNSNNNKGQQLQQWQQQQGATREAAATTMATTTSCCLFVCHAAETETANSSRGSSRQVGAVVAGGCRGRGRGAVSACICCQRQRAHFSCSTLNVAAM